MGGTRLDPALDAALAEALSAALAAPVVRIKALTLADGRKFWLKRLERLSFRLRLQKGDPAKSFTEEAASLRRLAALGLAVPKIVAEGADFILIEDAGLNLRQVIERAVYPFPEKITACQAAGRALAGFQQAGYVHGRPAPRDICWDGQAARFIDLERCRPAAQGSLRQALDLLILVQSCMTIFPQDQSWLDEIMESYRAAAPAATLSRATSLARYLALLLPLMRLLARLRPKSREIRALPLTLAYLRARA